MDHQGSVVLLDTFRGMCEVLKDGMGLAYTFRYPTSFHAQALKAFVEKVNDGDWRVALNAALEMRATFTDGFVYGHGRERIARALMPMADAIVRKMAKEIVDDPCEGFETFSLDYDGHTTPLWFAWTFASPSARAEYVEGASSMHSVWRKETLKQVRANNAWVWRVQP